MKSINVVQRILLIDDHSLVRDGIRSLLSVNEFLKVVGEAASAKEGLDMASQLKPDLLLVDIGLPDMTGVELTRYLKAECPGSKVIILSMYDNREYVAESVRCGASGYVLKNAPSWEILAAIGAVSSGGTFYSADIAQKLLLPREDSADLTPRELEVLKFMVEGMNNKSMAKEMNISVRTVEAHRLSIRRKLKIDSAVGLLKYAVEHGIVSR